MAEAQKKKSTYRSRKELRPRAYIADPMYVCMRTMLRTTVKGRPNTILYPWEKLIMPDCFRGRPGIVLDKCIACSKCVKICPNQCIEMVPIDHPTLGKVKRPQIYVGRCMMCGYCAEVCPTSAMIVTPDFELACYDRNEMMYDPMKLQHEHKPGYEVHSPMVAPSALQAGQTDMKDMNDPSVKDTPVLEPKKCISCFRCEKVCPTEAVKLVDSGEVNPKNNKPIKRPVFNYGKCVSCEQCVVVCPKDALKMKEAM
jgi:NADH-quinone oxidoreductase subunit I